MAVPKPTRPTPAPPDLPMVPFAIAGIAAWAVAGLVLLATHHVSLAQICLAGALWGIPGLLVMLRHDANRRAREHRPGQADSTSLSS